jgi:protein-S-isoprenylcysteine O-methyltransferase Ste14
MEMNLVWKILVCGWVASEICLTLATRTRRGAGNVKDRGSMSVIWVTITLAIFAGGMIRASMGPNLLGGAHWLLAAAIIVVMAGIAIRWTAILSLGKAFSPNVAIRSNQTIYRDGLYRLVRHPAYTGSLLSFLGLGIHYQNWVACLAVIVPITAAFLYRIHVEEVVLNEAFGEQYAVYSQQTKRLIPGIY